MNSFAGKFEIFEYIGKQVRVVYKEKAKGELEPWFVLQDVCEVLDIINSRDIKKRIRTPYVDSIYAGVQTGYKKDGSPAIQKKKVNLVNETGLYVCILRSRKKEAEDFLYYVAEKVLPELRRSGAYMSGMEDMPEDEKESLRCDLNSLQKKYSALEAEYEQVSRDYDDLFIRTKETLGLNFAMGRETDTGNDKMVITKEGWIVRRDMLE